MENYSQIFQDFDFIIGEINRINTGLANKQQDVFTTKTEFLYHLSNPSGLGITLIGQKAAIRFNEIAKRAHETDPKLFTRTNVSIFCKTIKLIFYEEIISKKRSLTPSLADEIVSRAVNNVKAKEIITKKFFWPCILPDDSEADHFSIGPILFTRTSQFFEKKKKLFEEYTSSMEGDINGTRVLLHNDLSKYYQPHPWVAEIEISDFEKEKSAEIANLGFNTALNILRLLFHWQQAGRIRHGRTRQWDTKTAMLTEENGKIDISSQGGWEYGDEKGWVQKVMCGDAAAWLSTAGDLIPKLLSGEEVPLLYQRYISALWWYGEAMVQEDVPYLKVVSLSNALEAFLKTSKYKISSQISKRATLFLSMQNSTEDWESLVTEFYTVRSDVVHGQTPAFDKSVYKQINRGSSIVHQTLREGLYWNLYLAKNEPPKIIEEIHQRFENDLPQYCRINSKER